MSISVLLVDNHTHFREAVRALLEVTTHFHIVGEAANGEGALALADLLHPNVVILDIKLPGMNGLDVLMHLRQQQPESYVIILSLYNNWIYVSRAIQNGASGYILKEDVSAYLAKAVDAAVAGQIYFSPSLL